MSNSRYIRRRIQRKNLVKHRKAYARYEASLSEVQDKELVESAYDMLAEFGILAVPADEYDVEDVPLPDDDA